MIDIAPRILLAILLTIWPHTIARASEPPALESMYQDAPKGLPSVPAWDYWKAAPTAWMAGRVQFHDTGAKFIGEDGEINKELFSSDLVHLNAAGYEILTAAVKPLVKSLFQ